MRSFFKKNKTQKQSEALNDVMKTILPTPEENVEYIKNAFFYTDDMISSNITWDGNPGIVIYLETMIDTEYFLTNFWNPLTKAHKKRVVDIIDGPESSYSNDLSHIVKSLLSGHCALFLQGRNECILFNCVQANHRSPDEPENEKAIRGSHKGFVENLDLNINSIRERIKNRKLTIKYFNKGEETNTNIAMIYMSDIANTSTVAQVQERIEAISSDMVFSPGYIEESMDDFPYSPFQQVLTTERPDRVKANLIEGRIAIMASGSTDATIVPVTFFSFFQSPDDYNIRFYAGTFFRLLRLFCFFGALTLPAIYIAVVGFHFEIIPHAMVTLIKGSIENVPFSPFVETLVMAVTIELIREAGIRLPTPIGQTIGIVGGLIIGDAVVNAGFVSNIMVIVIALTAIMSFSIPSYEMGNAVRLLSFPVMVGATTLGFVGMVFALMIILIHMCTLESFGTPYTSPVTPFHAKELKDAIVRAPSWTLKERPDELHTQKPEKDKDSRKWDTNDK